MGQGFFFYLEFLHETGHFGLSSIGTNCRKLLETGMQTIQKNISRNQAWKQ